MAVALLLFLNGPIRAAAPPPVVAASYSRASEFAVPGTRNRVVTTRHVKSQAGVEYVLFISAPEGEPPPGGFPVIYVLDGNYWFGVAAEIARVFESSGPSIVVGIGYASPKDLNVQRVFDTTSPSALPPDLPKTARVGGDDAFLGFIEGTVKPQIEASYKIDRSRQGLFGHSITALFVLHALYTKPEAFSTFIAASPSIWWNDFAILKQEQAFEAKPLPARPPRVLLTVGGKEAGIAPDDKKFRAMLAKRPDALRGKTIDEAMQEISKQATAKRMVDAASETAARLKAFGLQTQFFVYQDEEHMTVVPMAITRGLEMFLNMHE